MATKRKFQLDKTKPPPSREEYDKNCILDAFQFVNPINLSYGKWKKLLKVESSETATTEPTENCVRTEAFLSYYNTKARRAIGLMNTASFILATKINSLSWLIKQENHYLLEFMQFKNEDSRRIIKQLEMLKKDISLFHQSIPSDKDGTSVDLKLMTSKRTPTCTLQKRILRIQKEFENQINEFVQFHSYLEESLETCCRYYYKQFYLKTNGATSLKALSVSIIIWTVSVIFFGGKNLKLGSFLMETTFLVAVASIIHYLAPCALHRGWKALEDFESKENSKMIEFVRRSSYISQLVEVELPEFVECVESIDMHTLLQYWKAQALKLTKDTIQTFNYRNYFSSYSGVKWTAGMFECLLNLCKDDLNDFLKDVTLALEKMILEVSQVFKAAFLGSATTCLLKQKAVMRYHEAYEKTLVKRPPPKGVSQKTFDRVIKESSLVAKEFCTGLSLIVKQYLENREQTLKAIQECHIFYRKIL